MKYQNQKMILLGMSLIGSSLVALAGHSWEERISPMGMIPSTHPADQNDDDDDDQAPEAEHRFHHVDCGCTDAGRGLLECPSFGWWCPTCNIHHPDQVCPNGHPADQNDDDDDDDQAPEAEHRFHGPNCRNPNMSGGMCECPGHGWWCAGCKTHHPHSNCERFGYTGDGSTWWCERCHEFHIDPTCPNNH